ncbi:hypothetical protein ODS05_03690 [Escherichia coli]|nr:hypothetical protein [Escherichia coli]MCV8386372.1 hypothetical protein [Escherichia coli]
MQQNKAHEVIKLSLLDDFYCNLPAGISAAYNRGGGGGLDRKIVRFVLPRHFLPVNIVEPVAFVDGGDYFARLVKLEFCTGHASEAGL